MSRRLPNIIITGTPGVGKTSHCELLAERTGLKHIAINDVVKDRECHEGWDDEYQSWIVDEDKVCFCPFYFFFLSVFHLFALPPQLHSPARDKTDLHGRRVNKNHSVAGRHRR